MKIVVTGATGLVGQALVPALLRDGHSVHALVRDPKAAAQKLGAETAHLRFFAWADELPTKEMLGDVEAVIHLAGENVAGHRWTLRRKAELRDSRLRTAESLRRGLEGAEHSLKVFISASGIGFYGDRGDDSLTEKDPAGSDFLAKLCVDWEAAADRQPAARIVKARFGVVLQDGGGFLGQVVPLFKKIGASRLGDGHQWITWIHIQDVVAVLQRALIDDRLKGAINVVAPEAVTNATLTTAVGNAVGAWPGPPAPKFALRLLYGELADALLFSQKAAPKKLNELGFEFKYPRLADALGEIYH